MSCIFFYKLIYFVFFNQRQLLYFLFNLFFHVNTCLFSFKSTLAYCFLSILVFFQVNTCLIFSSQHASFFKSVLKSTQVFLMSRLFLSLHLFIAFCSTLVYFLVIFQVNAFYFIFKSTYLFPSQRKRFLETSKIFFLFKSTLFFFATSFASQHLFYLLTLFIYALHNFFHYVITCIFFLKVNICIFFISH